MENMENLGNANNVTKYSEIDESWLPTSGWNNQILEKKLDTSRRV